MTLVTGGESLLAVRQAIDRMEEFQEELPRTALTLWRGRGRQALVMNPDLVSEISRSTSVSIPAETWRTLPYITPLVVFPVPVPIPSRNPDERLWLCDFLVCGYTSHVDHGGIYNAEYDEMYDTDEADAEQLIVLSTVKVVTSSGDLFWEGHATYFNLTGPPMRLQDYIDTAIPGAIWLLGDESTESNRRKQLTGHVTVIIGSLMYLCSTVIDAETVPKASVRKAVRGNKSSTPAVMKIGWRIGPALSRYRRESAPKGTRTGTGVTMPPHQRRAHFRLYWTGKGRTVPKTIFVPPTWVHPELIDTVDPKFMRKVI